MFRKGDEPIPGYRLEKFLGKGQFGEVWRTSAPGGTSAALKFIDLGGKQGVKEFRGVKRVKEIRHANLMPITALWMLDSEGNTLSNQAIESYDPEPQSLRTTLMVDETTTESQAEWLVVAMLLGKKNLMDRLAECVADGKQGIPVDELLRYMEEAAKGIDYLNTPQHDLGEGIVALQHCDIKPANIMLIGDAAVVCDFGLARVLTDTSATATGMVGSPAYMAPENILRKPGQGSDQYALAVSYVELRTGQLPFKELTYVEVLEANRLAKLDLSRLTPAEQVVIRKATALKAEDRYPSAVSMVQALRRAVEGVPEPTRSTARPLLLAATVLLAVAIPVIAWLLSRRSEIDSNGTGNVTPNYTLTFEPREVSVSVNGARHEVSPDGTMSLDWPAGETMSIEVTGPSGYLPLKRQLQLDELRQANFRLQLERDGNYFAGRAFDLLAKDFDAAVEEYRKALRIDPKFERPIPVKFTQHTLDVQFLAITPNGKWLVSAADDGLACLWPLDNPADTTKPIVLRGHKELIESIAVSADSRWLVTGSRDGTAIAWDLNATDPSTNRVRLEGHAGGVVATAITPENPPRWVVTAGLDGNVRLWPFVEGRPSLDPVILKGHDSGIDCVRVSSTGQWLVAVHSEGETDLWNLSQNPPQPMSKSLGVIRHKQNVVRLTADEKWLITGDREGNVNVYALDGITPARHVLCAKDRELESLAIDPSGRQLFVGDEDGGLVHFELTADGEVGNQTKLGQHTGVCNVIAAAKDGQHWVTGGFDETARLWEYSKQESGKSATFLKLLVKNGAVKSVALSGDGKLIAAGTKNGSVFLWDMARCRLILRATGGDLDLSPGQTPKNSTTALRATLPRLAM